MHAMQIDIENIIGAMLFAAGKPLTLADMRRVFKDIAAEQENPAAPAPSERDLRRALDEISRRLETARCGLILAETVAGYRMQTDPACGPWLRCLLELGRPNRLSRPALETLAIIAYRQPVTRAEIEGVRGVGVDAMLRMLQEMQLIRITGRSELPGRPLLYATTQLFLDHFGLKDVRELPGIEQLCRREAQRAAAAGGDVPDNASEQGAPEEGGPPPPAEEGGHVEN